MLKDVVAASPQTKMISYKGTPSIEKSHFPQISRDEMIKQEEGNETWDSLNPVSALVLRTIKEPTFLTALVNFKLGTTAQKWMCLKVPADCGPHIVP